MSDVKVSIIIPFHNVLGYLRTSIECAMKQTLTDIEIICVNDNSDDASAEIVKELMENDDRIKLINLPERKGQGYARNLGMSEAQGEYIGFIDADDWVNDTMFEKLYNRAKECNSDISMCKTIMFDEQAQKEIYDGYYLLEKLEDFKDKTFNAFDVRENLLNINVAIWNKIYRREFLTGSDIKFPEGYIFEDLPFFFETYLNAENISIVDETLYYYRINRDGSTMQNIGIKVCDRIDMLKEAYKHIRHYFGYDEIETDILNWLIEDIFHRASVIEPEYFGEFFKKAKDFLEEIGFTSRENMKDKGIIFLDEVLFWLKRTPDEAMFFIRTFRTTDKKLDKIYAELPKIYSYSWETANSQLQPVKVDVYNIHLKLDELNTYYVNDVQNKINQIKASTEEWSKYFNGEFVQLYNNLTQHAQQTEENMNKLLSIKEKEITEQRKAELIETEKRFQKADEKLGQMMSDKLNEISCVLKADLENEKQQLREEYEKKLNDQRVKYERQIIKLEEDHNNLYKKLEPVMKILKFLGINKEKGNGQ